MNLRELGEKLIADNLDSTDTDDPADEFEELLPKHKKRKTTIVPLPTKTIRQKKLITCQNTVQSKIDAEMRVVIKKLQLRAKNVLCIYVSPLRETVLKLFIIHNYSQRLYFLIFQL